MTAKQHEKLSQSIHERYENCDRRILAWYANEDEQIVGALALIAPNCVRYSQALAHYADNSLFISDTVTN